MADETPRILVVDDELNICQNCSKILAKIGFDVDYALNGYDALKMMDRGRFDIVITDLKMASMGGMEVLRRVKNHYPDTFVIVITGYSSVSSAVEGPLTTFQSHLPRMSCVALSARPLLKDRYGPKTGS
jgi:DNA-binding NtrC family response regulator